MKIYKSSLINNNPTFIESNGNHHHMNEDEFGNKFWYLNGKRHRANGPVIEYGNGTKYWYLNEKNCSEKEYEVLTKRKNLINFL